MLIEIRWHGRAGQGVITVSRLLANAAILENKYAQAFPEFGPERIGAPISGFSRISDEPIEIHYKIYEPDIVVVLDPTVIHLVNVVEGLKKDGKLLVNSEEKQNDLATSLNVGQIDVYTLNATKISLDILGNARALNTIMLGALVGVSKFVSIESILSVLKDRFKGPILEKNLEMVKKGYNEVQVR